ncbi:EAL domain-containing protein [Pseudarthrobacter sp. PS3-L1]|uniref:putative bifunctional diguanylate cyclase/phosphodiesterase n=1 Tax=Pseudarthrobacter sp. PS3-L1 TaxID=3046207 RepID=UPI0024B93665|nr:EAL domain-containing protein [Pseudarthrobacter sp. PS3-L1]MDJ0319950.1 EAL domain-containing protein [Pseudarthrobacter sp. PS3-L1]
MSVRKESDPYLDIAAVIAAGQKATADVALITDATQAIVYVSPAFTAMTGYGQEELVGKNCRFMQGPGTDAGTKDTMREVLASEEVFEGEVLNYRKNGSPFWTALKIIPMRLGRGTGVTHYVSVQRDISNRVASFRQLQYQALRDSVTGLPNRIAAEQAIENAVKHPPGQGLTAAVGLIDLDDFRLVNNTWGHAFGDDVLRQWATRMLSCLREGDVLARMGGDEFLLIIKNLTHKTAHEDVPKILGSIHKAFEAPFIINAQHISVDMSLGIAVVPADGADSRYLLRSADEALYRAKKHKQRGQSWWQCAQDTVFDSPEPDVNGTTRESHSLEKQIDPEKYIEALKNNNTVIHFQPVVDLRNGTVHLFETLARLKLPSGRLAYPNEFLPHFGPEELRLLFTSVLDQALGILATWDKKDIRHDISVNLPPGILADGSTTSLIQGLLSTHAIDANRLGLELLESEEIRLEEQRTTLRELVDVGVGLAMDDLGSGYSSLQRLSSFPFNAIKIDRGLFNTITLKPLQCLSVIATLIQLGQDLGMNVVVEGLEDETLTEATAILGAAFGQGYYLAKPMDPEDCLPWAKSFNLTTHLSPIRTPLGALAYHLHFTRLAAPHPLKLASCPLTGFITNTNTNESNDVQTWHAHHHQQPENAPGSSQPLIDWLTNQITHTHHD